jgi:BirA family biotin operon repressor/biotin-[acetyl-CoA-carboxylase] ligase
MAKLVSEKRIDSKLCPKILNFNDVGSTNDLARKYIEEKNDIGFAITAEIQTAGQGQGGTFWESPRGGLWTSIAIKPTIELQSIGLIPLLSAISLVKALEKFNIESTLKWPNDILSSNFKKLGGILVETKVSQFSLNYIIIGIGLNTNNKIAKYSKYLRTKISTIFEEYKRKINLETLLVEIIQQIEYWIKQIESHGAQIIVETWKNMNNILGMEVVVQSLDTEYKGKAVDISPHGYLILETSHGKRISLSSGTVILKTMSSEKE